MQGNFFMQLILLAALFLLCGARGANGSQPPSSPLSGSDVADILKHVSGDSEAVEEIIKEAEHITEIISLVAPFLPSSERREEGPQPADVTAVDSGISLKPIANIADESIYNALSCAIS